MWRDSGCATQKWHTKRPAQVLESRDRKGAVHHLTLDLFRDEQSHGLPLFLHYLLKCPSDILVLP